MTAATLLGIDLGTSSAKAILTDLQGNRLAEATAPYRTRTQGTAAEQDAEAWWAAVVTVAQAVVGAHDVAAVAVTSQAPSLVLVDSGGNAAGPALTWLDRRATAEAARIAELVPKSRNGADPFFGTAKLPWLAKNRPGAVSRASAVLSTNGFVVRRLTGKAVMDETTASLMQGFDETTSTFDEALVRAEPTMRLLPPIVAATDVVGHVGAEASARTGIPRNAPVVAGAIDAVGSALEAGVLRPGDPVVDMTGFSSVLMAVVPRGTHVPGLIHARHGIGGVDLLISAQVTSGATVDWINTLDSSRDLRDDAELLARPRPGRVTMVPSLAGERSPSWNTHARGIIDGIDLSTDSTDLMLAAMEGSALALGRDVELLRGHGIAVDRLVCTGGGARSQAWLQIKADVLGVPVSRPRSGHGAAQGAALLAGLAIGVHDSTDAVRRMTSETDLIVSPNPELRDGYLRAGRRYDLLSRLNERWDHVAHSGGSSTRDVPAPRQLDPEA